MPGWRGPNSATFFPFGASFKYQLVAGDIASDGTVILRPRYSLNSASTNKLYGGLYLQVELLGVAA